MAKHERTLAAIFTEPTRANGARAMNRLGMTYKGYTGVVQGVDEVNGLVYGWLADIRDVIAFQGATAAELVADFRGAIDDYLTWCAADGLTPNAPNSGAPATRPPQKRASVQGNRGAKSPKVVAQATPAPRRKLTAKSSKPSA